MTLWDYLDAHPWLALMHGFVLVFIIMITFHAAIGTIAMWFGTAKKLKHLEDALNFFRTKEHDTEHMAAVLGSVMMAMRDIDSNKKTKDEAKSD